MKKVLYENLISGKRFSDYKEEYMYIMQLINAGKIKPVKNSPQNGKKPALYTKYWTELENEDFSEYIDELRYKINPKINIDFYLKHVEIYKTERDYVLKLSCYLTQKKDRLSTMMSENERSYDIWRREKFLSGNDKTSDGVSISDILRHTGITKSMLNVYRTAEPLAYYSYSKETPQNILIIENLDPFYSMRRYVMENADEKIEADYSSKKICGKCFGSLVYGGGKRVTRAFSDFEILSEPYMRDSDNRFYYAGDIDYEGIKIFEGLARYFKENGNKLELFVEIYDAMVDAVTDIDDLPEMKEQKKIEIEVFCGYFDQERADKIRMILSRRKYIPQEILSIIDY